MGMTSEDRQALVRYRMEKSAAVFVEAEWANFTPINCFE